MFRKFQGLHTLKTKIRFRGTEVKRIEAFSDAVFAFAVTLLIVSLEVPKNFSELMITIRGFLVFGISFILLIMIWYEQNIFFRRFGLDDLWTIIMNVTLIFIVLFYVYPLKFLFSVMFQDLIYGPGKSPFVIVGKDQAGLMLAFGIGYILIYLLFTLMYLHAIKNRNLLELLPHELFATRTQLYKNLILVFIGIIAVVISQIIPYRNSGAAGITYFFIGPVLSIFFSWRNRLRKKYFPNPLN